MYLIPLIVVLFFFNDTATTEIYTLSLHDALPIYPLYNLAVAQQDVGDDEATVAGIRQVLATMASAWKDPDRKSTRLNSSHMSISYAVFCLKKKKKKS